MVELIFFQEEAPKSLLWSSTSALFLVSLQLDPCSSVSQKAILTGLQINQSGHLEPKTLPLHSGSIEH